MATRVFLLGREFGERPATSFRNKQRIVTESAGPAFRRCDKSFDGSGKRPNDFAAFRQSQHAAEPPTPVLTTHLTQLLEQQRAVGRHVRIVPGKTSRADTRRAIQRVDLETGIVRQHPPVVVHGPGQRLDPRIRLERLPGFLHLRQIRPHGQILHLPSAAQNFPHLARFIRVARGQEQALL